MIEFNSGFLYCSEKENVTGIILLGPWDGEGNKISTLMLLRNFLNKNRTLVRSHCVSAYLDFGLYGSAIPFLPLY